MHYDITINDTATITGGDNNDAGESGIITILDSLNLLLDGEIRFSSNGTAIVGSGAAGIVSSDARTVVNSEAEALYPVTLTIENATGETEISVPVDTVLAYTCTRRAYPETVASSGFRTAMTTS